MLNFKSSFYEKLIRALDTNAVLMRVEKDGRYFPIWCSKEFIEMIEGTEEEFIKLESGGSMQSIHPDDREEVAYLFRHRMTKDGTNSLNIRKLTLKGNWIWVNVHYSFIEEDGVLYAYCNYFDITEIKTSEKRAQSLYETAREELEKLSSDKLVTWRFNITQNIIEEKHGSENFNFDIKEFTFSENVRMRAENFPLERDKKKFLKTFCPENILKSFEHGETSISEIFFDKRPDGRKCFVEYSIILSENPENGDIIAFAAERDYNAEMVNSIVLQKALVEQYDMITYLVEDNYGVVIGDSKKNPRGNIFPRKRYGSYSEYLEHQVKPVLIGTDEEIQKSLDALSLQTIERQISKKEPYEVNISCYTNGEIFYKRFVFYAVDKEAKFYIILKSDTTKIQREQIMRNSQLKNALDTANQASIAKTAFLSSMSHEIRTPMNAIIGLDSIALKEPNLSARTRSHLIKIGESAKHLLNLINDVLEMSRIESGRMILKNEEFSFSAMLEQINSMISSQCAEKGLTYDCNIIGAIDEFYIGDDMKLKQVLINILANAIKFTARGGTINFTVERTAQFSNKSTLRFVIKDTGIGMSEDFIPHIFDVFSQENSSASTSYGGTGLGMPITKNIVEMMSGTILVKSEKGVGSEFTVNITFRNSEKVSDRKNETYSINPSDLKVLIIDDDKIACEHAQLVLEEVGISSDIAMGGDEAVEMIKLKSARREAYDILLIDLKMPEQDGIAVTRRVREISGNESAIIILTAHHWDDIIEEALEAGVDKFMAKPLFSSSIMSEFSQAIEQKRLSTEEVEPADLTGRHILLAEDMFINAEIMKEILSMREMEVDHGENGKLTVELFEKSPVGYYDAVLMDIRMPVMDGLKATEEIRALNRPDAKTVPIIAITANAFDEDVQRSLQVGMNAHLSKPVDPEKLYQTLEEFIK